MAIDPDRPDYINGALRELVDRVKPHVHSWLLFDWTQSENVYHVWEISPDNGIERIAGWTSMGISEDSYESKLMDSLRKGGKSEKAKAKKAQARAYMDVVHQSILELIQEGSLEIVLWFGWPVLRLLRIPEDDELGWHPSQPLDRLRLRRTRFERLNTMPYKDYLLTLDWKHRREIHLDAAGNRCQVCNSDETPLHVHHRTYANRGREKFYDLVVLCPPCHALFHESGRKVR